jgi:hypothetical protein
MENDLIEIYQQLKTKKEKAIQNANRQQGALDQIKQQLKEQFECSSFKEAKQKLEKMKKQCEEQKQRFEKALEEFEEKWDEKLS